MAKILVVDDDARNLRLALTALEQAGHEALSAEGGAEGIEAALAHAPDLILMDVQMPGMDGITVLRRLRADPRNADEAIPSGSAEELLRARGLKLPLCKLLRGRGTFRIAGARHAK